MLERTGRHSIAATAMLAVWGVVSLGQSAAIAQPAPLNPGLTPLLRYFQLEVVSGRIVATSPHRDRRLESQAAGKDRRERLSATLSGDATTISYEQTTNDWQLSLEVVDGKEVVLRRQSKEKDALAPLLVFHQPPAGPISLRIGEGAEEQLYEAGNLWRLLVAEPEICREQLIPLVELLKPAWGLSETALAAEQALYDSVRVMERGDLASWQALVEQLGAAKFSQRQAADRQLRAQGRGAALYLMSIDWRRLDAEQQSRIRAMFDDASREGRALPGGGQADAPDRIALWLVRDPRVWLKLLERDDLDKRRLAAAQLQRLLSEPVAFDPAAEQFVRDAQIQRLRRELLDSGVLTGKTPPH